MAANFAVSMRMQRMFFDRQKVISRVGRRIAAGLNRAGTFTRRAARKLLGKKRKRGGTSKPGKPPYVHSDDETASLRNVQYFSDGASSVIIGPVKLPRSRSNPTVPALMEFGGSVDVVEGLEAAPAGSAEPVEWRPLRGRRPRPGQPTRRRKATIAPRPFMGPALAKVRPKVPYLFAGTSAAA